MTASKKMTTSKKSLNNEPVKKFISPREACEILGYGKNSRGSFENAIKNGSLRVREISPECGKFRAVYRPDVMSLKKANDEKSFKGNF